MALAWKANWPETQQHFLDWWKRDGLILGMWGFPRDAEPPHAVVPPPAKPATLEEAYADAAGRAQRAYAWLAQCSFPADGLPVMDTDVGPGSLAIYLGAEPGFAPDTVWFNPTIEHVEEPEALPPWRFDPEARWWRIAEQTAREMVALGRGQYMVGFPDLVENLDILASLREAQTLLFDMIERPEWVLQKTFEINQVYFEAYQRLYDIIKLEDGSSVFGAFRLWGPGKTAKVQCDASAMFSPAMFKEFVVPALTEQCEWLDHSMYHLDGTQCIGHLDHLLAIEALDAIEWTPQAGIEGGGSPRWYEMYHRILDAGKSLQVLVFDHHEIIPLLDELGGKGVYIISGFTTTAEAEAMADRVAKYR